MSHSTTYKPELMPRRGEYTAWGGALFSVLGLVSLALIGYSSWIANFFVGFLFFSAISISLGNWMDRNTLMQLDENGIHFSNGLRNIQLGWDAVHEVRVLPDRMGDAIHVYGPDAHFHFKTLGEMRHEDVVKARTGFAQGDLILQVILEKTGLKKSADTAFTRYTRS